MRSIQSTVVIALSLILTATARAQAPLGSQFTYQGRLDNAGIAATDPHDLQFTLFDSDVGGNALGAVLCFDGIEPVDGLFTVPLDFGVAFTGQQRFLQVAVRPDTTPANCSAGSYTTLSPRQPVTAAPYAEFALAASALHAADTATPAAFIDPFGNLTLATGANLQKLDSGGVARSVLLYDGSDNLQLAAPPDKTLAFRTGSGGFTSVRASFTSNGRLGIGTATPDTLVHILSGDVGVTGTISASNLLLERTSDNWLSFMSPANRLAGLAFSRPGSTATELFHGAILYNESALPDAMQIRTGGNFTRMTIAGTGEIGIGTTAPTDPLHIVDAADATLRLERTGGASVTASAQAAAGQIGTSNSFPLSLLTNNSARLTISSAGNVGINTTAPTARLHVVDATGGNGSVVLPNSSISAAEILDEPGCAGTVHSSPDVSITAVFPNPPQSIMSQSISAPAAGYVLAIATIATHTVAINGALCRWGLTTDLANIPADQMQLEEYQPSNTSGSWGMPMTLHRLFPVSAGTTTVHVAAQSIAASWQFNKAQLSLIYIPTTYGSAPLTRDGERPEIRPGIEESATSATADAANAEAIRLLDEVRAERAALNEDIRSLQALKTELLQLRNDQQHKQ
jgi:hypothetical protein